jgi:hypothetical protein
MLVWPSGVRSLLVTLGAPAADEYGMKLRGPETGQHR